MTAATTLTWKSALEVAERVYKSKDLCINAKFQADINLSHKATFEQLQKNLASLAVTKADEPTKRRLMVILGLTNPAKKEEDKGSPSKPIMTLADFKKAAIAASKSDKAPKVNPKQLAKQKQIELSLLLFAHDFMKFNAEYQKFLRKKNDILENLDNLDAKVLLENNSDFFSFFLLHCKGLIFHGKNTESNTVGLGLGELPDPIFTKLKSFESHPDPEIRKVVKVCSQSREVCKSPEALSMQTRWEAHMDQIYTLSPESYPFLRIGYPNFIIALECLLQIHKMKVKGYWDSEATEKLHTLHTDASVEHFLKTYDRLYQELHQIQNEYFSSPKEKEDFLQRFHRIREEIHPAKANQPFSKPEELRNPSLVKKTDEKEKPKTENASKVEDSFKVELPKPKEPRTRKKRVHSKAASVANASTASSKGEHPKAEEPKKAEEMAAKAPPASTAKIEPSKAKDSEDRKEPPKVSILQGIFAKRDFPYEQVVYDSRVKSWDALKKASPAGFTEDAVWKHSCAPILERFLGTSYSFRDLWQNFGTEKEDLCFCIIADVTSKDGLTIPGVFQFTFDDKGVCYHRWFGRMSNIKRLDKVINQRRREINFPPLKKPQKPHVEELDTISFEIDPFFGSITFDDKENGLKIKIYKVEE